MLKITISVKDSERTYTKRYLEYDYAVLMNHTDHMLKAMVAEAKEAFGGEPDDVIIRVEMVW